MFTLSQARGFIGSAADFARGGAYVQEGRVSGVTAGEHDGLLRYSGIVRAAGQEYAVSFDYDEMQEAFAGCACSCGVSRGGGCRHAAALMIAVCGGAGKVTTVAEGSEFISGLLGESRLRARPGRPLMKVEPVRLYVTLRRESAESLLLGLKLGRTRAYVVRSMSEFAARASRREQVVYGRELTFSHREDELEAADAALFGQIVMLAGDESRVRGGELLLSGAALDQTMRMLDGREAEIRTEQGEVRRARVVRGDIALPIEMTGSEERAQLRVFAQDVVLGNAGAYAFAGDEIRCAYGEAFERVASLLRVASAYPQGVRFHGEQLDAVCTRLILPAGSAAVVRKGQEIVAAHTPTPATPRLYIDMEGEARLLCRVRFDYLGTELAPGAAYPHIRRDTALEEDVCAAAQRLFPEVVSPGVYAFEGGEEARFQLLSERLAELECAGEVLISEQLARMNVKKRRPMTIAVVRSDKQEKLLLRADLGGLSKEDLAAALAAYRQKRKYVRLTSGAFLSGEALEQAADAAQVLDTLDVSPEEAQAGAEIPESRAMYLDAALKGRESITLKKNSDVDDWLKRLEAAKNTSIAQPAGLNAQLRSYQLTGLTWLRALSDANFCGILADDMGLGKTIQMLALLLSEQERGESVRALVVCPASLQLNWRQEARKFAPSLRAEALMGGAKERAEMIAAADAPNILITSYDQLRRDVQCYEGQEFTHVLLDEAQNIKNAASQAARAVKTIRAKHRFAMTGTPIENRLSELWSIFDFLMPGYLLSYKKFKDRFEAPVVRDADEKARENLHLMAAPFILRRMKKDVLDDLPEKVETVMESDMTAEQRRVYAAYAAQLMQASEGGLLDGKGKIEMLAGLTRLRQLCCDPRLCLEDYSGGSGKLDQLSEVVHDAIAAGHHMLIFSQFTTMLDLIRERLESEGVSLLMLTGDTDKEERMRMVAQFNEGAADAFLISLKAGGTGLNLTGADVVIHYDPWWNMAAQNQATDRAYRIGQTKGVQVIRMIASDSVEERILALQESKQALGDGVLMGEENLFTIDAELLRNILK